MSLSLFNPISFIDNVNEKNKIVGINKFVDIIAKYSNIGKKQQQTLRDATREAFLQQTGGKHPSFSDINTQLLELVGDTRDTLTDIIGRLSEYELFDLNIKDPSSFLNNNYYFSLSGEFGQHCTLYIGIFNHQLYIQCLYQLGRY